MAAVFIANPHIGKSIVAFMWAPVNNQSVQVSMGYFLFPLAMVLSGYLVFGERLSKIQKLALFLAMAGVGMEIVRTGAVSWVTLWVCATYPIYYVLRRNWALGH